MLLSEENVNAHQQYVFEVNNKASPPINMPNKCNYLVPYFPSLECCSTSEHDVMAKAGNYQQSRDIIFRTQRINYIELYCSNAVLSNLMHWTCKN
jgi:hypothetical protein